LLHTASGPVKKKQLTSTGRAETTGYKEYHRKLLLRDIGDKNLQHRRVDKKKKAP